MQSTSILLDRGNKPATPPRQPSNKSTLPAKSPTAHHLEILTTNIITSFNALDFSTPFTTHASPSYTYAHRHSDGTILHLDRSGAQTFVEDLVKSKHPQHYADILSLATTVDEESGHANVWLGFRVRDGEGGRARERVSVYGWRWEGERWVWWTHGCADDVPGVPF